ncbi:IS3 family transposase [Alicyclobacillus acidocaldarius]
MCKVLGVSRSGYYAWRERPESLRSKRRKRRIRRIHELFLQSRRLYGKITVLLRRDEERIAQKTVARLMRDHGLRSRSENWCTSRDFGRELRRSDGSSSTLYASTKRQPI